MDRPRRDRASDEEPTGDEPDDFARNEAIEFIAKRTAIWALPLSLVGVLLVALGIPWWAAAIALVATLIVLVFEVDI